MLTPGHRLALFDNENGCLYADHGCVRHIAGITQYPISKILLKFDVYLHKFGI